MHIRNLFHSFLAGSFLLTTSGPVLADPFEALNRTPAVGPLGAEAGFNRATAGVYLRLPFGYATADADRAVRFGLAVTLHRPGLEPASFGPGFRDEAPIFDLSLTAEPDNDLRLNGIAWQRFEALYAGEEGDEAEKGGHAWRWILIGAAGIGGVALAASAAAKSAGKTVADVINNLVEDLNQHLADELGGSTDSGG